ncbi:MAG: hypothetical protein H6834_17050 [Planctomycetes bacterium]|nr:hypothetical protein [Planctomycetota bacterium]
MSEKPKPMKTSEFFRRLGLGSETSESDARVIRLGSDAARRELQDVLCESWRIQQVDARLDPFVNGLEFQADQGMTPAADAMFTSFHAGEDDPDLVE